MFPRAFRQLLLILEGPSTQELGTWVWGIAIIVQVFGKYMIIWYLDPQGTL